MVILGMMIQDKFVVLGKTRGFEVTCTAMARTNS
jgi:hypothetical protein